MIGNEDIYIKVYRYLNNKIESYPMEELVKMVIISQIDIDFHMELIKSQAIIARTQIVKNAKYFKFDSSGEDKDYDLQDKDLEIDIVDKEQIKKKWGEKYNGNMEKLEKAIKETEGLIMTYNNKPIVAHYHDTCGGATENSENVMGNQIIYLRKVLCNHCENSPNWRNTKDLPLTEIEEKLGVSFPQISPKLKTEVKGFIEDVERDNEGRVTKIKIAGKTFKGKEIKERLGLNSTRFSISPPTISFNTQGKGHGLGVCHYGGNKMAQEGYVAEDILKYYYTGICIKRYFKPCIKKPLSGRIIILDPAHGGDDRGSIGQQGLIEKDLVLDIGKNLKEELQELGAEVLLTRDSDEYLSLNKRVDVANERDVDFFISLNMNSYPNPQINGCEIYHYRGDKDSNTLGKYIMDNLVKRVGLIDKGVRTADFFLLKEVGNSALELFIDYLTNQEQEEKLKNKEYRKSIVKSIVQGIVNYYKY